jgi:hypothetical protein
MKIQYASDLHLEFAENWRFIVCENDALDAGILAVAEQDFYANFAV